MGIGAFLAIQHAVRQQKFMERQMMARRIGRVHLRRMADGSDAPGGALPAHDDAADWEPFDCQHLCIQCGYLADVGGQPCPACGRQGWVDLQRKPDADAYRQMERRDRQVIPRSVSGTALGLAIGTGVAAAFGSFGYCGVDYLGQGAAAYMPSLVLGVLVGLGSWVVFPRLLTSLRFRQRPTFPSRWRLPLPLPDAKAKPADTLTGEVEIQGPLLRAPISGAPCVAYEVAVVFDTPEDKRPPMWVLEEERSTPFAIGGHAVPADGVTLQLKSSLAAKEDLAVPQQHVVEFLRKRGLFASEGEYQLYEALVQPGESYRLETFDGAVPRLRPA